MRHYLFLLFVLIVSGCGEPPRVDELSPKELVVVTFKQPLSFFEDADGQYRGIEHDLITAFAAELGREPRFIFASSRQEMLAALENKKAHFAAGLSIGPGLSRRVKFGAPYRQAEQRVVYRLDRERLRRFSSLAGKRLAMTEVSASGAAIWDAQRRQPTLKWQSHGLDAWPLLQKVALGELDYVLAHSAIADFAANVYPELGKSAYTLAPDEELAWAFSHEADSILFDASQAFIARAVRERFVVRLVERYQGHIRRLTRQQAVYFRDNIKTVLPRYRRLFQQAQQKTGIDWRLLAALGYQESQWDPLATSPTNVRGLMMLTEETAQRMGARNRLDSRQSIFAGARYLKKLKEKLPRRIPEPDRTWIALAAYNLGHGHLEDGRVLTQKKGLNPDLWLDVKKTLPLLDDGVYARVLRHGVARGGQAVVMTESIRAYYDVLKALEPKQEAMRTASR
jgi:membrane-bound lytic murein transglycosylase F